MLSTSSLARSLYEGSVIGDGVACELIEAYSSSRFVPTGDASINEMGGLADRT